MSLPYAGVTRVRFEGFALSRGIWINPAAPPANGMSIRIQAGKGEGFGKLYHVERRFLFPGMRVQSVA